MMKNAAIFTVGALSFVLLTGFGGCRRDTPEERARHVDRIAHHVVDDVMDDVDANDDQRARVQKLADGVVKDVVPLIEQHPAVRAELWTQWSSKQPDAKRVHAIVDDRVDAVRGLLHKVADAVLEVHSILTPEQRAEITSEWRRE